jgi:O-antigen/teichoic acid export membrane protein
MLRRELDFRRKQFYEVVINVFGTLATVALAFWLRSVWALALAQLYYGLAEMIGSYIVHPFRPRFRIYWAEARDLFHFGKHLFMGGLLHFFRGSLASLLLGKLLGTEALGYYTLAQSLVVTPVAVVGPIFGAVLYSAYSRLQDRLVVLRRAFLRSLGFGCLVISPILVGIAVTAGPLVHYLYGPRYAPVAPVSMLFCLVHLFLFLERPAGQVLTARGKPGLRNLGRLLHPVIFLPLLFPLALQYGTIGVVAALGAAAAGETLVLMWLVCDEIELSPVEPLLVVARPVLAALFMGVCVWALGNLVEHSPALSLVVMVPSGVLLYALWTGAVNRPGLMDGLRALTQAGEPGAGASMATEGG